MVVFKSPTTFFSRFYNAIDKNFIFCAIVYHHDMFPHAHGQGIAIAGIHVGDAVGMVGCPHGFAVGGQGDFPALLPAAVGQ